MACPQSGVCMWQSTRIILNLVSQCLEEIVAAIFNHIHDMFEALVAAVVRIGHLAFAVCCAVVGEAFDFMLVLLLAIEAVGACQVFLIHGKDEVVIREVGAFELAGVPDNGDAAVAHGFLHAWVGGLPNVKTDRARGFDFELIAQACLIHEVLKHAVGCGGSANIAHAKEEGLFHAVGNISHWLSGWGDF